MTIAKVTANKNITCSRLSLESTVIFNTVALMTSGACCNASLNVTESNKQLWDLWELNIPIANDSNNNCRGIVMNSY